MGIYDSGMSCWERRMAGLPADNAGETKPEVVEEVVVEEVEEEKPVVVEKTSTWKKGKK